MKLTFIVMLLIVLIMGFAGFILMPKSEIWPEQKSQLVPISGKVVEARSYGRGSDPTFWIQLDRKVVAYGSSPDNFFVDKMIGDDAIKTIIGRNITAGCLHTSSLSAGACLVVSLEADGRTILDYQDVLRKHMHDSETWQRVSQLVLAAAGFIGVLGIMAFIRQRTQKAGKTRH